MKDIQHCQAELDWHKPFNMSQATIVDRTVYVSGQASIDSAGNIVGADDFQAQARQVFSNLEHVLRQAGSGLDRVFKVNIYLTDVRYFDHIVECRKRYFTPPYPADTTVEVSSLALPGLMLEIDVMARCD
ncbi:RidA family protein [Methylonatrum kenyense]|uniref:RidA family protein n=1 Tax=Methylonatrum kenyense TaxID=455253 RepID=UPI0020BF0F23|nr:RidA family protein [Methylonatrum kenyense]MCK8514922.1 RidA family protein [Methylonatrum kenyense]